MTGTIKEVKDIIENIKNEIRGTQIKIVTDAKLQDNNTIGLLLCKNKDKLSVDWSLEGINNPIDVSSFKLDKYIPKDILEKLPTEKELNLHINIDE